jgi:hypothetical protein
MTIAPQLEEAGNPVAGGGGHPLNVAVEQHPQNSMSRRPRALAHRA